MDFPLRLWIKDDFIVALKPSGLPTHRTDVGARGFVELLEDRLGEKLYIVHRLDKDTSGLLVVARSPAAAEQLTKLFSQREVTKKYVFRTKNRLDRDKIKFKTLIEKQGKQMVSIRDQTPNSETLFLKIKSEKFADVWEAEPKTGKTHQIRLHAKDLKISIDGDKVYGGAQFPRLCLQSQTLGFPWQAQQESFEAPMPVWLEPHSPLTLSVEESLFRRSLLYTVDKFDCYRCVHTENPRFRMDQFGDHWWVYWYDEELPTTEELNEFEKLAVKHGKKLWIREMKSRGGADNTKSHLWGLNGALQRWQAQELGVQYEFRADQGMSPGLFLDQRLNREWVRNSSKNLRVLNLFAYTSGFSVNAALGGAAKVTTVDLSQNFIKWSQNNFELNSLNPTDPRFQFWSVDTQTFLKKSLKRQELFDLIICDPPSFGRSDSRVFQIQRDWQDLLQAVSKVLAPGGRILFSTNYERWSSDLFFNKMEIFGMKKGYQVEKTPLAGFDFETPQEVPLMKSAFLIKPR